MVQGGKSNLKSKIKREKNPQAPKRKNKAVKRDISGVQENTEISKKISKQIKEHQKKIYKSIEQTIIGKAKQHRETFDII